MRGNDSEREVLEGLEGEGWTVHTRGWPDFICVRRSEIRLIEVKSKASRKLSAHQRGVFSLLAQLGISVEVVTTHTSGRTPTQMLRMAERRPSPGYLAAKRAQGIVTLNKRGSRLQVSTPFRAEFVAAAKILGGRYRKKSCLWSFPLKRGQEVTELLQGIFGESAISRIG